MKKNSFNPMYLFSLILMMPFFSYGARKDIDLGTSGNSFLDTIIGGLQIVTNAIGGPGVIVIILISFVIGIAMWTWKPDSKATMFIARVLVGAIALCNLTLFFAWVNG